MNRLLMWFCGFCVGIWVGHALGCAAGLNADANYCDPHAAVWDSPTCTVVSAQGAYADDLRYVCPQPDGTEWSMRVVKRQDGGVAKYYERYDADGANLCLVGVQ